MDEELQVVYELGCIGSYLDRRVPINQKQQDEFAEEYLEFKTLASKLGADLPDQPPKETINQDDIDQFYSNQVSDVENYLKRYKDTYTEKIFTIADCVQQLLIILHEAIGNNESLSDEKVQRLQIVVKELEIRVRSLGIDISEELREVNDHEKLDEHRIHNLKLELKTKLCKRANEPTQTKRSEIDPTRIFTDHFWAVSLVQLPDDKRNRKHAFLVLEGKVRNKSMIWFVDFVPNDESDLNRSGMRDGKVRIDKHETDEVVGSSSKLLFRCDEQLMNIRESDRWLYKTWAISKSTALTLIQNIKTRQKNPPKYNIRASSSDPTTYNCFTFVGMILRDLNDEYIQVPRENIDKWIVSLPIRVLVKT